MFKKKQQIIDKFIESQQPSAETVDMLWRVFKQIEKDIKRNERLTNVEVVIYGSLHNGLFNNNDSDIDISIFLDDTKFRSHLEILNEVRNALRRAGIPNTYRYICNNQPYWIKSGALLEIEVEIFG